MKIGLIGFFGAGAYSDDLIEYTTRQLLKRVDPEVQINSKWRAKCYKGTDPRLLNKFDIIVQAGGSLLGKCNHYPIKDIANWYDKVEIPIAIFGAGYRYEPDKEPLNAVRRRRLQLLFDKAEVISVRGHRTIQHLEENHIDTSKVTSLGDPVMSCNIKIQRKPRRIVGNVRNSPVNEVKHASNEETQRLLAEIYDWLIDKFERPLILVSFRHVGSDSDVEGAKKMKRLMKNEGKVSIRKPSNFRDAMGIMRHATFWFGQRLHPTIFAGIQNIPFVGVEYQFEKMIDWTGTVGIDNYIHTRDASLGDFIEKFNTVSENMHKLRRNLPIRIKEIHEVAEKIMELA